MLSEKKIAVEYLYLDLHACDRCIGTDSVLDEVMIILTPALKLAGYDVEYSKTEIETKELALKYQFLSSPTIRVNGKDICQSVAENSCGCCSEISGTDVDCRVFEYKGENYEIPPKEMLAEAILHTVFGMSGGGCTCGDYKLPENLRTFFNGKNNEKSKSFLNNMKKERFSMALFGNKNKKDETSSCCCGGKCDAETMAKAEKVKTEGAGVKVLGSGCAKCNQLEAATKEALQQLGMDTTIDHVTDFSQIASYGIMTTPALVIDGKVVAYGKVLKTEEVVKILRKVRG